MYHARSALTMIEAMISVTILASVFMAGVFTALSSGVAMKNTIAKADTAANHTAQVLNTVIADLRYADVNMIYLDGTAWSTTSVAGDDLYSFKVCTAFAVTDGGTAASLDRLMQYGEGVILRFTENADGTASLYRTVLTLDTTTGVSTGTLIPETLVANNLVWEYTPVGSSVSRHGFTVVQPDDDQTAVIGNRLAVRVATYTGTGIGDDTAYKEAESAVYLRASLFAGTGSSAPEITSAATKTGYVGSELIYDIVASYDPTRFAAASLPAGLTVNAYTGRISGSPTTQGTTSCVVSALNDTGTDTQTVAFTINGPVPVVTSSQAINGTVDVAISYQMVATNTPTLYAVTGLPSGLSVNTSTGVISGTVSSVTTANATMTASNVSGASLSVPLVVSVTAAPPPAPTITSTTTSTATSGSAYTYQITASSTPTSFNATGLPTGFTCNTTSGLISGTSVSSGTFSITLSATNVTGTGTAALTLVLQAPIPVVSSSSTASASVGTSITYQITASNTPTSYSASGLPSWMTVNTASGLLYGNPTGSTTTSTLTVNAVNSYGTGTKSVTLTTTALPAPTLTLPATMNANVGTLFSYTPAGTPSITAYSITGLPATITMPSTSTGAITGTPTAAATYELTMYATNATGTTAATTSLVVVVPATAPIVTLGNRTGTGHNYQYLGTVAAGTGRTLNTSSFVLTDNQRPMTSPATFTVKRGWIAGEASGTSLTATQFLVIGFKLVAPITITASISDTGGLTGTTTRTY